MEFALGSGRAAYFMISKGARSGQVIIISIRAQGATPEQQAHCLIRP
jgi:formate dehydrogenase assembly factor FdhD